MILGASKVFEEFDVPPNLCKLSYSWETIIRMPRKLTLFFKLEVEKIIAIEKYEGMEQIIKRKFENWVDSWKK